MFKSRFKTNQEYYDHVRKMKEKGFSVRSYEHTTLTGIVGGGRTRTLYYASTDRNTRSGYPSERSAWESLG